MSSPPIKVRDTLALLFALGLAAVGLVRYVASDAQAPTARLLVAECQGFQALATAGREPANCDSRTADRQKAAT